MTTAANPFALTNKTALVTGAGSGIGAAIARQFAYAGAFVYLADRDEAAGRAVLKEIVTTNGKAQFIPVDVVSSTDCARAEGILKQTGHALDILVNNAGIGHVGTMLNTEGSDLDRLYDVNVRGMFNMSKVMLPGMIERGAGVIINMASIGGIVGIRDRLAYCTTKFAVVGMTKSMALDHAAQGIRINCICPGRVETPFVQARLREYPDPEAAYREMAATQAVGRMGTPEEIAAAALYLASDAATFITGTAFLIDGGWSAGK